MEREQVKQLVEQGEGLRIEFKEAKNSVPGSLFSTVAAFSNTDGGTILLVTATMGRFATKMHSWLGLTEASLRHFEKCAAVLSLPGALSKMSWGDLLLHLVPIWYKNGTQLTALDWPQKQPVTAEDIKTVPGWQGNGTQLLKKKGWYFIAILSLCVEPARIRELLEWIGYKNEKSFRDKYIHPLRAAGLLEHTVPDQPTNPENRYVVTEKGRIFLSGL
jgi:ATP-dependent DNA helicase RecG